jgi:arginine repressor
LRTVLANIVVPTGASMTVINGDGAYVPLKMLNYDTTYVNVTVNSDIYLSVIAENGVTEIVYQLIPSASESDAFVTSDVYSVVQKDVLIQFVSRGTDVRSFIANLVPSAGATMKLMDKMGNERLNGAVADDDKVVVTSKNGSFSKVYFISKQATQYVPVTTYLAYILSNVYAIDQVMYKVAGVSGSETVSSFLTKVTPSAGAAVAVVDKDGTVKINGDIDGGDKVMVTSADGKMKVYYSFGPLTSARDFDSNNIELYPNPTNGEINVSGVNTGQRIQVYNSAGAAIREINVQNSIERISLSNQPAGMYMIVVSDNNKLIGRYKLMKR